MNNESMREYEQGEVIGEVRLTPIQSQFLKWNLSTPNHFNQSVTLELISGFEEEALREVLKALVIHHDILRAVLKNGKQEILKIDESKLFMLEKYDYKDLNENILEELMYKKSTEIESSIDLSNGPLMKAALYKTSKCDYLMICSHHLVIDGASWRILIEDLINGYSQYIAKKKIILPKKTASYQEWSEAIYEYSQSEEIKDKVNYWTRISEEIRMGKLGEIENDAKRTEDGYGGITITLNEEKTNKLLDEVVKIYKAEIIEILIAVLGISVRRWKGKEKVALHMEGHGREKINKAININRTVGWFTSIYPVMIEIPEEVEDVIVKTKEALRNIPNNGMEYSVIQHSEKYKIPEVELNLSFIFLGQWNNEIREKNQIILSGISGGRDIAADNKLINSIPIVGIIMDNKLVITILFDRSKYSEESIRKFSMDYENALNELTEEEFLKK